MTTGKFWQVIMDNGINGIGSTVLDTTLPSSP